jgi:hypothetical protein
MRNSVLSFISFILILALSNNLRAQGPNAPEAMSFEPVDATDMVNLVTGDFSYVLPLLNVPSPEGGYPIALSYHAGIAMDQEASWVGLGWSLNPGSLTRSINGVPDDWGKTNVDDFFFDEGWEEDYYSITVGVGINDVLSVGVGVSWGSNQSLGGFVDIGAGIKGTEASVNVRMGTNGASIGVGINGYRVHLDTNGNIGVGKGILSLNYNPNEGLSGGINLSSSTMGKTDLSYFTSSVGYNFKSKKANGSFSVLGNGLSASSGNQSTTISDYYRQVSSNSFTLPLYYFYIGYNHTKVKYSLYKITDNFTSGTIYPVETLKQEDGSNFIKENYYMDIDLVQRFDKSQVYKHLLKSDLQFETNTLTLPAYDNYMANAQGLNVSLSPYYRDKLNLSGRGREYDEDDYYSISIKYYNEDFTDFSSVSPFTNTIPFSVTNEYNSFIRVESTDIGWNGSYNDNYLINYDTHLTDTYNPGLPGEVIYPKVEGNFIKTFTNDEIVNQSIPEFIEAKNIDRNNTSFFPEEGIGAYKITTPDGKTYHYSLPVYNFDILSKKFDDVDEEFTNFYDYNQSKPFATHWLLTAITGPDYVDANNDGALDENDYGYWVEFDYGKWSDGYVWQTPIDRFNEIEDIDDPDKTMYNYSIGIKQNQINNYQEAIQKKLKEEDQKATQTVINDINDYVKEYGKKHNYDIIFGASGAGNIMYAKESTDLTEVVLEGLNKEFEGK